MTNTPAIAVNDPAEMEQRSELRRALFKTLWRAVLALFVVPLVAFVFVSYVDSSLDRKVFGNIEQQLASRNIAGEQADTIRKAFHAHAPSMICEAAPEDLARFYRGNDCEAGGTAWQFHLARQLGALSLLLGLATLLAVGVLGRMAFINRHWQYGSLMVGWRMLMASSVVQVLVQGTLAVWLAFWLPAYFLEHYSVKLIALVAVGAGAAALVVIAKIFHRPKSTTNVEGERLTEAAAPRLWQRVRQIAERLQTAAPNQIIGGIDANFFVTEMPVTIGNEVLQGRTLFVSIPLLRIMSTEQADAVLSHELAHFSGGDTTASARLNPALLRFDHYLHALQQGGMSVIVYPLMHLYRLMLQLAMSRESRAREFKADSSAASVTSPRAMSEALVKVAAYSSYRAKTEEGLIARWERLSDQIGLGASVAQGLQPYSVTEQFVEDMRIAPVPHPFDSHPPMAQRMQNVGYALDFPAFGGVVSAAPEHCWTDDIDGVDDIEARLWAVYERRFASKHEMVLAYRYQPATEAERAIVLKYFPAVTFPLNKGAFIEINHEGIVRTGMSLVPWGDIKGLKHEQAAFTGDKLTITLQNSMLSGSSTVVIKAKGLGKAKQPLLDAVNRYWHRHQVMRSEAASRVQSGTQGVAG